jgi:phosphoglucomutase
LWLNILAARKESVNTIVRRHWAEYGRNYYSRHDYEEIDSDGANALIAALRERLPGLKGKRFGSLEVLDADDFAYHDPVDGSDATHQGVRILLDDGARLIYRLSGTGTAGATLRVYLERYEAEPVRQYLETQASLTDLVGLSKELAEIKRFTGRNQPSVIT